MNATIEKKLRWRCPRCGAALAESVDGLSCGGCHRIYTSKKGRYDFIARANDIPRDQPFDLGLRDFFKRWPRAYYFIGTVFGPMFFSGVSSRAFFTHYARGKGICLNIGSGPRVIDGGVINVDIAEYRGVHIRADATNLPLQSGSIGTVICDELVEHVPDCEKLLREIHRVLKPQGFAYITVPFLYPFHSSPGDYARWTHRGFIEKLSAFEVVESGIRAGVFSTLTVYCCYLFALTFSFNSSKLFWILVNVSMFIFFPIKIFDVIANRLKASYNFASVFYYIVRKG